MLFKTYVRITKRKQTNVGTINATADAPAERAAPVRTSINLPFHILNIHMHYLKTAGVYHCQLFCYCFG